MKYIENLSVWNIPESITRALIKLARVESMFQFKKLNLSGIEESGSLFKSNSLCLW